VTTDVLADVITNRIRHSTALAAPTPRTLMVIEPRCRICADPGLRSQVDRLLIWRGAPVPVAGRFRTITYADVLAHLPISRKISYSTLWRHAKRHYGTNVAVLRHCARLERELQAALDSLDPRKRRTVSGD